MKLVTLLGIFALWCGMLGAQIFYPVEQGLWENLDFCLFGGGGLGKIKDRSMKGFAGGLSVDAYDRIRCSVYGVTYTEDIYIFTSAKYNFEGLGYQVGLILPAGKVKFTPSIGYEHGDMRIGEGDPHPGLFGPHFESYRTEKISYMPLSVDVQMKMAGWLAMSAKGFYAFNPDYPVLGFMINCCIGKI